MQKRWAALAAAGAMAFTATTVMAPRQAQAQTLERTSAFPQGTIGGSLLGMELVMLIEGAAGVRNGWIMLGTGLAGGIAGGVGGYFLDSALDATGQPQGMTLISTSMLVVGLGLVIPTAIVFTGATMYRPPEVSETTNDEGTQGAALEESGGGSSTTPAAGAGSSGGSTTTTTPAPAGGTGATSTGTGGAAPTSWLRTRRPTFATRSAMRAPTASPSLFNLGPQGLNFGVPSVGMVRSFSIEEQRQYNLAPQSEWRVNVISGSF
jgi:hypothetical protein